nr:hypothetical protein [Tanacetum cinerariifolium]
MTTFPEILRRVRDKYHNLKHDEMVKSIFNSGMNKAGVGMKILSWMITDEMKLTENYQMYAEAFRVDVPTTQSQPIETTQGMHRTTSAPSQAKRRKVKEHLITEEIEKMVEGTENVENDKESMKVEKTADVQPINVIEVEEKSANDDYELRRRQKGKEIEETRNTPPPTPTRSTRNHSTLISPDTENSRN